jgi:hypothetical protein
VASERLKVWSPAIEVTTHARFLDDSAELWRLLRAVLQVHYVRLAPLFGCLLLAPNHHHRPDGEARPTSRWGQVWDHFAPLYGRCQCVREIVFWMGDSMVSFCVHEDGSQYRDDTGKAKVKATRMKSYLHKAEQVPRCVAAPQAYSALPLSYYAVVTRESNGTTHPRSKAVWLA